MIKMIHIYKGMLPYHNDTPSGAVISLCGHVQKKEFSYFNMNKNSCKFMKG